MRLLNFWSATDLFEQGFTTKKPASSLALRPRSLSSESPIKPERTVHQNELIYWLTYWVVFALFTMLESVIDWIFFWSPNYTIHKFDCFNI